MSRLTLEPDAASELETSHRRSRARLMARPRSGSLRISRTARGRSFAARFTLHGREHFEFIGGEWDGWTEAQARAQLAVTMRQVNNGEWMPAARYTAAAPAAVAEEPTFQVLASLWLDRQRRRVADKTAGQYGWALAHLIEFFADDLPSEIDAARIDDYVDSKLKEREAILEADRAGAPLTEARTSRSGRLYHQRRRPLSNESINKQVDVLARVLKEAKKRRYIGENPAADGERKLASHRRPRSFLEPEQIAALLEAAAELERASRGLTWEKVAYIRSSSQSGVALARELGVSDVLVGKVRRNQLWIEQPESRNRNDIARRALLATLTHAGLRIDELCGLRGADMDFARRRISITRENTKTPAGVRLVQMSPALHEALLDHRQDWPYSSDGYVFGTRTRSRNSPDNVRARVIGPAVALANEMLLARDLTPMSHVTPHTLRRTFVSMALIASSNDIRWVMSQVGHADHKMTYAVYAQLQKNLPRDYGHRVDDIIGGSMWYAPNGADSAPTPDVVSGLNPDSGSIPTVRPPRLR